MKEKERKNKINHKMKTYQPSSCSMFPPTNYEHYHCQAGIYFFFFYKKHEINFDYFGSEGSTELS